MPDIVSEAFQGFPVKPGDWVSDGRKCARVRDVRLDRDEILADLVMYNASGTRIGRESPHMGGPKGYEPCISLQGWDRIAKPKFPLHLTWVQKPGDPFRAARIDFGPALVPRQWLPQQEQEGPRPAQAPNEIIETLKQIARGHNDPRTLAADLLTRLGIACPAEHYA